MTGALDPNSGTYTPDEAPPAGPPNPYRDPYPWGTVIIGGVSLGLVMAIDGHDKPEEWSIQKGTGSSGASTIWKGTKLAESIKITSQLWDEESFSHYYVVRDALRPKLGTKPPSLILENPAINAVGITRVACVNVGPPKPDGKLGWTYETTLTEYNPTKPAKAGPAAPAHPIDKREIPPPGTDENGNVLNPEQLARANALEQAAKTAAGG